MRPEDRIVVSLPIAELWDDTGTLDAQRRGDLSHEAIKALLRDGPVQFVVAILGEELA